MFSMIPIGVQLAVELEASLREFASMAPPSFAKTVAESPLSKLARCSGSPNSKML
jgi:hypothetical protein